MPSLHVYENLFRKFSPAVQIGPLFVGAHCVQRRCRGGNDAIRKNAAASHRGPDRPLVSVRPATERINLFYTTIARRRRVGD